MMKSKEYKEAVTKNLKSIRRSSDLEMLYKFSELCKRLENNRSDGKDFERFMILRRLFFNDMTEKQLHMLEVFIRTLCSKETGMERSRDEAG